MYIPYFSRLIKPVVAASLLALSLSAPAATQITALNFDSSTLSASNLSANGWTFGAQNGGTVSVSTDKTKNYNGSSGSIKATYPASGCGICAWGTYSVKDLNTRDLYIEFWAKMPVAPEGVKFLKIFGQGTSSNFANTTFGLDWSTGTFSGVIFGDGSSTGNDAQNIIRLNGATPELVGRSYGKAVVQTPQNSFWQGSNWGTSWHHFKFHVKFNSGTSASTEVADGELYVEIDGKVYLNAKNLFNRHYSNLPIDRVALFDWTQGQTSSFEVWYDDITISTGGFVSGSGSTTTTAPPAAPSLNVAPL